MRIKENKIRLVLTFVIIGSLSFTGLQYTKNLSPQETVTRIYDKIFNKNVDNNGLVNLFPSENKGLYDQLNRINRTLKHITSDDIVRVFGIHLRENVESPIDYEIVNNSELDGINYNEGLFVSYDSVEIPFYEIFPNNFDNKKTYRTVILFSGHGNMDQVAFDKNSYQKGIGVSLAKQGFLVYVMENRGMGKLSYLGDHMRIDAVARMVGGSWYGEITTDALFLLEMVNAKNYSNSYIGVGGVSTGGALSLLTSAIDKRISATFVQGYLGSYKTTFGSRGNHHECNNISDIIDEFDMADIGALIFPRSAMYVNGEKDTFYPEDASKAFEIIKNKYVLGGATDQVSFKVPENTKHELSGTLALKYFSDSLMR